MTEAYVFPPPPVVSVPVVGGGQFPVRRIYCVGRNYIEHIKEMGGDVRAPPFFFQKPTDAIVQDGAVVPYPPLTQNFQYEIELVLAIHKGGKDIPVDKAHEHVFGLGVGVDLTRRDVQIALREVGRPWEAGKSFDASAPISAIHRLPIPARGEISLSVNGETKQKGDLDQMIWSSEEIVSQLSSLFELQPGDLIYTGTPSGVGKIGPGDRIEGSVEGVCSISFTIGS